MKEAGVSASSLADRNVIATARTHRASLCLDPAHLAVRSLVVRAVLDQAVSVGSDGTDAGLKTVEEHRAEGNGEDGVKSRVSAEIRPRLIKGPWVLKRGRVRLERETGVALVVKKARLSMCLPGSLMEGEGEQGAGKVSSVASTRTPRSSCPFFPNQGPIQSKARAKEGELDCQHRYKPCRA